MRKLAIILTVIVCFLAIDVYIAHLIEPQARTPIEALKKVSADLIAQALVQTIKIREKLPKQVDNMTQLIDVAAERNMVIYHMAIVLDGPKFDAAMNQIRNHLNQTACLRDDYRKMLTYGLAVAINYHSPSGKSAVPVMITPQMCGMGK